VKAFKLVIKRQPTLRNDIEETLWRLADDPFASPLATHKFKGQLSTEFRSPNFSFARFIGTHRTINKDKAI
jgi:mRNA-degrading endonuclease YafQ of YafQ-DinJ toxin-antitoxin module